MRRLLRLLFLCTLVLALPLQGAWATDRCAGAPQDGAAAAMHHGAHCPHAPMRGDRHADAGKDACGACCGPLLAAMPGLAVSAPAPVAVHAIAAAPDAAPPAFLTGGLDRPPRTGRA